MKVHGVNVVGLWEDVGSRLVTWDFHLCSDTHKILMIPVV